MNEADFYVDFSPYQLIYVVSPAGSGIDYSPGFTPNSPFFGVKADGNNFTHGATLGNDFYVSDFYGANVLIHETAHTFGLPDLYDFDRTVFPYSTFVGDWDMMGNLDVGAGFVAWQRLQLGWIDPEQVACVASADSRDVRLSPMEQAGGTKAAIVQTGPNDFFVAENRLATAEDALLCDAGMLVYHGDPELESGARLDPRAARCARQRHEERDALRPALQRRVRRGRRRVRQRQRPDERAVQARQRPGACGWRTASRSPRRRARCACRPRPQA